MVIYDVLWVLIPALGGLMVGYVIGKAHRLKRDDRGRFVR